MRQLAWGDVKDDFFENAQSSELKRQENLHDLKAKHVLAAQDPRLRRKKVFDSAAGITRSVPLFATYRGEEERDEIWDAFASRTAEDLQRREENWAAWVQVRRGAAIRIDPECTFEPALADLPRLSRGFPHLRATADRLEHQTFEERMEETLSRRAERRRVAEREFAPDLRHLPAYLTKASVGFLSENKHPERLDGWLAAEEAGFGDNIIAHGPFEKDRWGRPLAPRGEAKALDDGPVGARSSWAKERGSPLRDNGLGHVKGGLWGGPAEAKAVTPRRQLSAKYDHPKASGDGWIED